VKKQQWLAFASIPEEDTSISDRHLLAFPFLKSSHLSSLLHSEMKGTTW